MHKEMGFYKLKEGTDPKEFFKFHTEVHSADVKRSFGPERIQKMHRYCVNRVADAISIKEGEVPNFSSIIEMWWESKEAHRGEGFVRGPQIPPGDFEAHGGITLYRAELEEKQVWPESGLAFSGKDKSDMKPLYKVMTFYALKKGTNPDEFFKYHTEVHSADVKRSFGSENIKKMHRYCINRVTDVISFFGGLEHEFAKLYKEGREVCLAGIVEMWWESKEAYDGVRQDTSITNDFDAHGGVMLYRIVVDEGQVWPENEFGFAGV